MYILDSRQSSDPTVNACSAKTGACAGENAKLNAPIEIPAFSLSRSGGIIKWIEIGYQAHRAEGTAKSAIPLSLSPALNGFGPGRSLALRSSIADTLHCGRAESLDPARGKSCGCIAVIENRRLPYSLSRLQQARINMSSMSIGTMARRSAIRPRPATETGKPLQHVPARSLRFAVRKQQQQCEAYQYSSLDTTLSTNSEVA